MNSISSGPSDSNQHSYDTQPVHYQLTNILQDSKLEKEKVAGWLVHGACYGVVGTKDEYSHGMSLAVTGLHPVSLYIIATMII